MNSLKSVVIILVALMGLTKSQNVIITSPEVTNWGDWGVVEVCPAGTFVYGMRVKTEEDQGTFGDDSALNGVELFCISPTVRRNSTEYLQKDPLQRAFASIKSAEGHEGIWGHIFECPEPDFGVGFELRSESDQGVFDDDTAANNFRLFCSGGTVLEGDGHSWGSWTGPQNCPRGLVVCGIQTQVDPVSDIDDTTVNNVNIGCCEK